ncbi:hypothetical protein SCHPADRAFT_613640 [Schizopora paradoxa]|uniref:DUF6533 domain-containing protein n=1 Tax=Schizopora paradoxa TaxID=27342 RepID=A0A0H2R8Y3_9AGAM|nr:hypothetical protein SCHPADRAFT_613640 [Schizopora paradoxa]
MSAFESELAALAAQAIRTFRFYQYSAVVTVCLVCYEYLIKFDDEVRYLWHRRFKLGGILLFLCRYLPFTAVLQIYLYVSTTDFNQLHCLAVVRTGACFIYAEFVLTLLVLSTRAYAVWSGALKVLIPLIFLCTGAIGGSSYTLYLFIKGLKSTPFHISSGCIMEIGNNDVWIELSILLFSESMTLGILLVKSFTHAKVLKGLEPSNSRRSLLAVMTRDGIGYFACTVAITATNLFVLTGVTPNLRAFLLVTQGAMQNIMCSRLLFHTHSVNEFPDTWTLASNALGPVSALEMISQPCSTGVTEFSQFEFE